MKKHLFLVCIFLVVFMLLTALKTVFSEDNFADLVESEEQTERYHPNGSEPVYVGIFGR